MGVKCPRSLYDTNAQEIMVALYYLTIPRRTKKELSRVLLSYFGRVQNYLQVIW